MNIINRHPETETSVVELKSRNGLTLTIMEYSNKGVIIITRDSKGNELSRILIDHEGMIKEMG